MDCPASCYLRLWRVLFFSGVVLWGCLGTDEGQAEAAPASNKDRAKGQSDGLKPFEGHDYAVFFDDFCYTDANQMNKAGYFLDYPTAFWNNDGSKAEFEDSKMILHATRYAGNSGEPDDTARVQSTFKVGPEGTYAARIKFNATGRHGFRETNDQDFYAINREYGNDIYAEVDFEYLSPCGWPNDSGPGLFYPGGLQLNSWKMKYCEKENPNEEQAPITLDVDLDGAFKIFIFQVTEDREGRRVRFFVEGVDGASNRYPNFNPGFAPDSPMLIEFSNWFSGDNEYNVERTYTMEVDWLYYSADPALLELTETQPRVKDASILPSVDAEVRRIRGILAKRALCFLEVNIEEGVYTSEEPVGVCPGGAE